MRFSETIPEEELKNKVAAEFFDRYDCTAILGKVDFSVSLKESSPSLFDTDFLAWGEAKKGRVKDLNTSLVQLILTIGKERTFDKYLPPRFLCEFDSQQIAFIPYEKLLETFYINDFNWNTAPSDHTTKEFRELYGLVEGTLSEQTYTFRFDEDETALRAFIKDNFRSGVTGVSQTRITKNNFISIFNRWLSEVKPSIEVTRWDLLKKSGVSEADFFIADVISKDNVTLMKNLQVILLSDHYQLNRAMNEAGLLTSASAFFNDKGKAHKSFWLKYRRPPEKEFREYIPGRRDLLLPQDIRERKGSYFTPKQWVELSQKYLEDTLGENWQEEYYIWDCCAGTGNLLAGLTNKYNIYASTLDKSDVDVIHERIDNGANLLHDHVFKFDFLNDGFEMKGGALADDLCDCKKLPESLREILKDADKRKRLILYQNPPYAETAKNKKCEKDRKNKRGVSFTLAHKAYGGRIGIASKELFAQFLTRCLFAIPGCKIANFSKLKHIQGPNFDSFRKVFRATFRKGFIVPANTFDNVRGTFPIGFMIWDTEMPADFGDVSCDVFDRNSVPEGQKRLHVNVRGGFITDWFRNFHDRTMSDDCIGAVGLYGSDFQHSNDIYLTNPERHPNRYTYINETNILEATTYLAVRHCEKPTWKNDRDQFLYPGDGYAADGTFRQDCLVWSVFECNNFVSGDKGNPWIPYTEDEVGASERFKCHLLNELLRGKRKEMNPTLFSESAASVPPLSEAAEAVLNDGREIWRHYHRQPDAKPDASFYEIKGHFQKFRNGKMNGSSDDPEYNLLMKKLRTSLKVLTENIRAGAYRHGFLL